jgi:hypothetical protein
MMGIAKISRIGRTRNEVSTSTTNARAVALPEIIEPRPGNLMAALPAAFPFAPAICS